MFLFRQSSSICVDRLDVRWHPSFESVGGRSVLSARTFRERLPARLDGRRGIDKISSDTPSRDIVGMRAPQRYISIVRPRAPTSASHVRRVFREIATPAILFAIARETRRADAPDSRTIDRCFARSDKRTFEKCAVHVENRSLETAKSTHGAAQPFDRARATNFSQ